MPELIPVHDQQVNIARKASASVIDDLLDKFISFAGNINENKDKLAAIVWNALDQYNDSLLINVDKIGTIKLNFNSATFTLDERAIEELENINNTQRLLLHQVRVNNIIKAKLKDLTETASLDSILNLLKGLVELDDYANYMAKFPGIDPESFRKFQLLNHYAYISFSSLLYDETIYKLPNHEKTTINKYIQEFIDNIYGYPTELVLKENYNLSHEYQDELTKNFLMAIKSVVKRSTTEQEDIIEKIRAIIPSLLQIRNTENNERRLKLCINELLELEKTSNDFSLTIDFFNSYFDACYKEHSSDNQTLKAKKQQEKAAAKERINEYIHYVRNISKKEIELPQIEANLCDLEAIKVKVTQLQLKELLSTSLISDNLNEDLKKILARIAEIGFDSLTELFSDYSDFVKTNKVKLTRFKEEYNIEGNIDLLVDYIEHKLNDLTITPRAQYYNGLLSTIEKNIAQQYLEINKYINAKIDHAEAITHYPHNSDSEVIAADKISVLPANVYNPLINKINYHMPRDIADKLKILNSIEQEIISVNSELSQFKNLTDKAPIVIQTAVKRLSQIKDNLVDKQRLFENNLLKFSVDKMALLLQEQKELFLNQNREQLNNLLPISLAEKERLDEEVNTKTNKLAKKLVELQSLLTASYCSRELLAEQLSDIKTLITQLELEQCAGKRKFDFTQVNHDLKSLIKYYTNETSNKLNGIKRNNPSTTPIPYNRGETTPQLIGYARSFTLVVSALYAFYYAIKKVGNTIAQTFGLLYRMIARLSNNNKILLNRMDTLSEQVSKSDCKDKSKLSTDIALTRDKIGRFSTKPSNIVEEYDALNSRFLKTQNPKVVEIDKEPSVSDNSPVDASPISNSTPLQNSSPSTTQEFSVLLQKLIANPATATEVTKQACYAATTGQSQKLMETRVEELGQKITTELHDLHKILSLLLPEVNNPQIKIVTSQIRALEKIHQELELVKKGYAEVARLSLWEDEITDESIQKIDSVNKQIVNLDHQVNEFFDTATSVQTLLHCLKNFVQASATSKEAAMQTLLKNAVIEVAKKERIASSTGTDIAKTALIAVLNDAPSVLFSMTDILGAAHDMVACKNIINASFNAVVEQLKKNTDIKELEKACKQAASIALTKEISQLGSICISQAQRAEEKQFKEKIKKLSESASDYLLQLYAASQGLQLMLFLAEREPKVRDSLQNVLIQARDSITDALIHEKSAEEIIAAAKIVVCEETKKALGNRYIPTCTAKKIEHPDAPKPTIEKRLHSGITQLTTELEDLGVQHEKLLKEPADGAASTPAAIQFKITEKAKSIAQLKEIQAELMTVLAKEAQLNTIASSYPFGEEQFKIIYHEEKYAPVAQRKVALEQALDDVLSPGVMAELYTFFNNAFYTMSEPTQDATANTLRDILNTTAESLKQNDTPADTAFKVLDVTLQSLMGVMNTLNFGDSTKDRKETIQNLIKKAIEEAVRTNHENPNAKIDPMFLAKQALIKVLKELQNPKHFEKITVNWCTKSQMELFKIGSDRAISQLQKNNSTLSEAAEVFCSAIYTHVHSLWLPNPLQVAVKRVLKPNPPVAVVPTPPKPSLLSNLSMFTAGVFRSTKRPVENQITSECELV